MQPTRTAIGTWSGGRFMHFGEPLEEARLTDLLRPGGGIDTVITADTYGQGEADALLGRAIAGVPRDSFSVVGAVGHDFYEGERNGPKGFPRFTHPSLRGPDQYEDYLRRATERSLERLEISNLDVLLLHNPDRTGYSSEVVWSAMAKLRDEGVAGSIGVAPGPANGFTLDLIDCLERFGSEIDWAMVILNPFEPWPGELILDAAVKHDVKLITRVVDYGGLFWGDVKPGHEFAPYDHRKFRPEGWIEAGNERLSKLEPILERTGLTLVQLACAWNLAQPAVECVAPTLIQEVGPGARPVEDKRAELAALPADPGLTGADLETIREIGENANCMALKGASVEHEGEPLPDRWPVTPELEELASRWGIRPDRDLVHVEH
jgi:aryl-alcohol dehydrogenase-like predicted oxidoreductase